MEHLWPVNLCYPLPLYPEGHILNIGIKTRIILRYCQRSWSKLSRRPLRFSAIALLGFANIPNLPLRLKAKKDRVQIKVNSIKIAIWGKLLSSSCSTGVGGFENCYQALKLHQEPKSFKGIFFFHFEEINIIQRKKCLDKMMDFLFQVKERRGTALPNRVLYFLKNKL